MGRERQVDSSVCMGSHACACGEPLEDHEPTDECIRILVETQQHHQVNE
jgi:hypothetical protein